MERSSITIDLGASDNVHAAASRAAALVYASMIESKKPELARQIREAALAIPCEDEPESEPQQDSGPQGYQGRYVPPGELDRDYKCPHHGILKHEDLMRLHDEIFCGKCYQELFQDKGRLLKILVKVEKL